MAIYNSVCPNSLSTTERKIEMPVAAIAAQVILPMITEQMNSKDEGENTGDSQGGDAKNPIQSLLSGITGSTGGSLHK